MLDDATPQVRKIGYGDLRDAFAKGLEDFNAVPSHAVFLSLIYPIVGIVLGRALFQSNIVPLVFPLIAGFALLGPFAAIGLYEISRLREQGQPVTWRNGLGVLRSRSIGSILVLGGALLCLFLAWLGAAYMIYRMTFGAEMPVSITEFIHQIFTTSAGVRLLVIGNAVGALFALVAFAISVVSFPLLVDRDVGAAAAVVTSLKAILTNPIIMLQWGILVAVALAVGSLPFLFGLAVVIPILGHATWHLYRKVVV